MFIYNKQMMMILLAAYVVYVVTALAEGYCWDNTKVSCWMIKSNASSQILVAGCSKHPCGHTHCRRLWFDCSQLDSYCTDTFVSSVCMKTCKKCVQATDTPSASSAPLSPTTTTTTTSGVHMRRTVGSTVGSSVFATTKTSAINNTRLTSHTPATQRTSATKSTVITQSTVSASTTTQERLSTTSDEETETRGQLASTDQRDDIPVSAGVTAAVILVIVIIIIVFILICRRRNRFNGLLSCLKRPRRAASMEPNTKMVTNVGYEFEDIGASFNNNNPGSSSVMATTGAASGYEEVDLLDGDYPHATRTHYGEYNTLGDHQCMQDSTNETSDLYNKLGSDNRPVDPSATGLYNTLQNDKSNYKTLTQTDMQHVGLRPSEGNTVNITQDENQTNRLRPDEYSKVNKKQKAIIENASPNNEYHTLEPETDGAVITSVMNDAPDDVHTYSELGADDNLYVVSVNATSDVYNQIGDAGKHDSDTTTNIYSHLTNSDYGTDNTYNTVTLK